MSELAQTTNRILLKLSEEDRKAILSCMELIELDIRELVYEKNRPIESAYFPDSGIISIVTPLEDGSAVEVATIGNEGMVGLPLILQTDSTPTRAFCQVPGKCWRMSADDFRRHASRSHHFSRLLLRYAQALFDLIAQTSACNRLHTIEERCARWLLLLNDRTQSYGDTFPLTQEFLAQMLGVQRSGVNLAAGALQKNGLITYARGKISILDRSGLESVSCECYRVICKAVAALDASD